MDDSIGDKKLRSSQKIHPEEDLRIYEKLYPDENLKNSQKSRMDDSIGDKKWPLRKFIDSRAPGGGSTESN